MSKELLPPKKCGEKLVLKLFSFSWNPVTDEKTKAKTEVTCKALQ